MTKASPYIYPGLHFNTKWQIKQDCHCSQGELDIVSAAVCDAYEIEHEQLLSRTRYQPYPDARKVFIHLCRVELFNEITCKRLGIYLDRDHSTVTIAEQRAGDLMLVDRAFRGFYRKALELSRQRLKINGYQYIGSENLTNNGTRDQRIPSLANANCREGSSYTAETVGELNC